MSGRQNNTAPVVKRRYLDQPDACIRAVGLLLMKYAKQDAPAKRKAGGSNGSDNYARKARR